MRLCWLLSERSFVWWRMDAENRCVCIGNGDYPFRYTTKTVELELIVWCCRYEEVGDNEAIINAIKRVSEKFREWIAGRLSNGTASDSTNRWWIVWFRWELLAIACLNSTLRIKWIESSSGCEEIALPSLSIVYKQLWNSSRNESILRSVVPFKSFAFESQRLME